MTRNEDSTGDIRESSPDRTLVRAAVRGDERAFAWLVRRYLRKAMAVAVEYTGNREDAEDVVQDTFRRMLGSLDRFNPERSFEPWFFTILRNTARTATKSRRLRATEPLPDERAAATPDPLEMTHRLELRRSLDQAVGALPTMQQRCFRLCLVEGLTSAEAAYALGLAESTVRVHVHKARQTLQRELEAWRGGTWEP
ncbi:MAG: RNA polymerase sigma factor [Gemmatimonadales bacterium]